MRDLRHSILVRWCDAMGVGTDHHGHQLFQLVDVALDHRVDRPPIQRQQRTELEREAFVELCRLGLERRPDVGPQRDIADVGAWAGAGDRGRLPVVHQQVRRTVFAKIGPLAQLGQEQRRVFLVDEPGLNALRLYGHGVQHGLGLGAPVRVTDGGHAQREGMRFGLAVEKAIDDVGHHGMHLRGVIDAQHALIGAQQAQRFGVPGLVARLAQNPIDDGLFGTVGRRDAHRVGADVVIAPHWPWSLGSSPVPCVTRVIGCRGLAGAAAAGCRIARGCCSELARCRKRRWFATVRARGSAGAPSKKRTGGGRQLPDERSRNFVALDRVGRGGGRG
jgi:hypothetical protein